MKSASQLHATHTHYQEAKRDSRRHRRALATYFRLPKYLSSPELHEHIWHQRSQLSPSSSHEYSVGSAMLGELALVSDALATSERHAMLDMATWDLDKTLELSRERHADQSSIYHRKFLCPPSILRLEARRATMPLFRAMINGDVDRGVRKEYAKDILTLSAQASERFEYFQQDGAERIQARATEYIGLAHELNAIYSIARKQTPTLAAFTTFPRGDSGEFLPQQTHDIHIVGMRWGSIEHAITAEVKTRPKPEHYERYEAILIGGTLHLHPNDSPDPAYLTERFVKEYRDIATETEQNEIEDVSQTVMHSVRHGFTNTTQCRNPKTCTLVS